MHLARHITILFFVVLNYDFPCRRPDLVTDLSPTEAR